MENKELLAYMRQHQHVVLSSIGADGAPQAALVGIAVLDSMELVFDTVTTSRKHANLSRDGRAAVTFSGPDEQTLQLEGIAYPVSVTGAADLSFREGYYRAWPDGPARLEWPGLCYWRVMPRWARYSDFNRGPLIAEFHWTAGLIR
ncbi:MAG: pyridoxamine 5'-phosphate oxidase family protein [Steroidobacterales bacterium]